MSGIWHKRRVKLGGARVSRRAEVTRQKGGSTVCRCPGSLDCARNTIRLCLLHGSGSIHKHGHFVVCVTNLHATAWLRPQPEHRMQPQQQNLRQQRCEDSGSSSSSSSPTVAQLLWYRMGVTVAAAAADGTRKRCASRRSRRSNPVHTQLTDRLTQTALRQQAHTGAV